MAQYTQSVQQELHSGSQYFTAYYSAVQTDTEIIAAPGSKSSIYISDVILSNGDTAGKIWLTEAPSGGTALTVLSLQNYGINTIGVYNFSSPLFITPNAALELNSGTTDDFSVTINYYIDEVKGFGYTSGGYIASNSNTIDENFFASDSNSTDVGNLTVARYAVAGQSSAVSGYTSGGLDGVATNVVDKFSFSSDGDSTDVGNLTVARYSVAGQSSAVSGYTSGGYSGGNSNVVDKFSFSSDGDSTDVGNLTVARYGLAGQSSAVSGYSSGGNSGSNSNVIDKSSFSSDGNSTDCGDLTVARRLVAGQQSN